jgi:hypothetical protein
MGDGAFVRAAIAWLGVAAICGAPVGAALSDQAAYVVGDRLFPATPTSEDPFIADAVAGTIGHLRQNGGPNFGQLKLGFAIEKRITTDLGVALEGAYEVLSPLNLPDVYGFENFEAMVKYQAYKSDAHEAVFSVGLGREFGGTGASRVGAEPVGATTPALYFGKGLGDLPDDLKYLRPFAVTGSLGYQIPDRRARDGDHFPSMAVVGASLQYSLRYLQGNVQYIGLPPPIGRLTALVEFTYAAPVTRSYGQGPTALLAPGLVYSQEGVDYAVEALVPLTRQAGAGIGFVASMHIPLGKLSAALGKPLFGE